MMRRDEEEIEEGGSGCLTWPPMLYKVVPKLYKGRLVGGAQGFIVRERLGKDHSEETVGFFMHKFGSSRSRLIV